MNRVIKFRAWDGKEKKWRNDIALTGQSQFIIRSSSEFQELVDKWYKSKGVVLGGSYAEIDYTDWAAAEIIIQFFTGLLDKNGKEGYHKDIVSAGKKLYIIEWQKEEARFWLAPTENNTGTWKFMDELSHMTIIGNIYENSDLIPQP